MRDSSYETNNQRCVPLLSLPAFHCQSLQKVSFASSVTGCQAQRAPLRDCFEGEGAFAEVLLFAKHTKTTVGGLHLCSRPDRRKDNKRSGNEAKPNALAVHRLPLVALGPHHTWRESEEIMIWATEHQHSKLNTQPSKHQVLENLMNQLTVPNIKYCKIKGHR